MESLYYYRNIPKALKEIHRVLKPAGLFVAVVDLYWENEATHQWIDTLNVPVELLSVDDYHSLFIDAGFINIRDERLFDPTPIPDNYTGSSFKSREDYEEYKRAGSLMMSGEVAQLVQSRSESSQSSAAPSVASLIRNTRRRFVSVY